MDERFVKRNFRRKDALAFPTRNGVNAGRPLLPRWPFTNDNDFRNRKQRESRDGEPIWLGPLSLAARGHGKA